MAALAPLAGRIAGVERRPITFEADGLKRTVRVEEGRLVVAGRIHREGRATVADSKATAQVSSVAKACAERESA